LSDIAAGRFMIAPLPDRLYAHTSWLEQVQHIIGYHAAPFVHPSIGLFGHERDNTSAYLRDFPEWKNLTVEAGLGGDINATFVRQRYFGQTHHLTLARRELVPASTVDFLIEHADSDAYRQVQADHQSNKDYEHSWGKGPHVTADSVLLRSGRVLLINRGARPLKGTWALPGGFLEVKRGETLYQCATRELVEETQIDLHGMSLPAVKSQQLTAEILAGALRAQFTFDDPHRSERGRIITTAFGFDLGSGHLPPVEASDDAEPGSARWVPLSEIREDEMFDDHGAIIRKMISLMQPRNA
jgi:bifunctional NMN adenylyltransferase/nudix hydrolase